MHEKIFNALKQAYSHLGLGDSILTAHAAMLEATGVVTDENLTDIVAKQSTVLEAIQKANDKRAADAAAKAAKEAKKAAENEARKAAEEAERKAAEEKKPADEIEPNIQEPQPNGGDEIPSWFKAQQSAMEQRIKEALERNEELSKNLQSVKDENDKFRSEQAAAKRNSFIASEAKRLGVPEWRASEGFNITDSMDEGAITEYLTKVSNNVKANMLPAQKEGFPQFNGNVTKEETDALAAKLLR